MCLGNCCGFLFFFYPPITLRRMKTEKLKKISALKTYLLAMNLDYEQKLICLEKVQHQAADIIAKTQTEEKKALEKFLARATNE